MPTEIHGKTITTAMDNAVRHHLEVPIPDAVLNIETHLFHVTISANSCEYSLDLGREVWLNKSRWSRLIREYINNTQLWRFIKQGMEIYHGKARKGATANMLFRDPERFAKKHRWGGCLMGVTFRGEHGNTPILTFFSRTTYMGYMGLLDAGIAHIMAQYISGTPESAGEGVGDIGFRWHISSQQLHCFKTIPHMFSKPDLMADLERYTRKPDAWCKEHLTPTWRYIVKWYRKILEAHKQYGVKMLDHEKYGPFRRIKRRWLEYKGYSKKNLPKSVMIRTLDFTKAVD